MNPAALLLTILAAADPPATAPPAPAPTPQPWTWSGVEILGNHHVPRAAIEDLIPIPIGASWTPSDPPTWKEACAAVEERFDFATVECGDKPLRVFNGRKAILIVDVVERGNERVLKFRPAPGGTVPFADPAMAELSNELSNKTMAAAMAGRAYRETVDRGYLFYADPKGQNEDVGPLVERLARIVPQHRDNVFDVLRGEKDENQRQVAATLLNWAGGDPEKTIREALPMLDDPDPGVRNNVSRFMIKFVENIESKRLRQRLLDTFLFEIQRPSHGDRNKGLYNLLSLAQTSADDRAYIRRRGVESIRYIAENSIVFNVKGPAEELLALVATNP